MGVSTNLPRCLLLFVGAAWIGGISLAAEAPLARVQSTRSRDRSSAGWTPVDHGYLWQPPMIVADYGCSLTCCEAPRDLPVLPLVAVASCSAHARRSSRDVAARCQASGGRAHPGCGARRWLRGPGSPVCWAAAAHAQGRSDGGWRWVATNRGCCVSCVVVRRPPSRGVCPERSSAAHAGGSGLPPVLDQRPFVRTPTTNLSARAGSDPRLLQAAILQAVTAWRILTGSAGVSRGCPLVLRCAGLGQRPAQDGQVPGRRCSTSTAT